ncbi:MAG: hypothetical protein SP1CHLAM54_17980 [Chlamydiia bacterium]|nr:hypothetical protein [Chlamydiia bacterium]MCH9616685.1 hypothetical protein [Chlamydiia bacterium]MCH9629416.1 hypothetical protein [Chlamydiia bacterium]
MFYISRIQDFSTAAQTGQVSLQLCRTKAYQNKVGKHPEENAEFHATCMVFSVAKLAIMSAGESTDDVVEALSTLPEFKHLPALLEEGYEMTTALRICKLFAVRSLHNKTLMSLAATERAHTACERAIEEDAEHYGGSLSDFTTDQGLEPRKLHHLKRLFANWLVEEYTPLLQSNPKRAEGQLARVLKKFPGIKQEYIRNNRSIQYFYFNYKPKRFHLAEGYQAYRAQMEIIPRDQMKVSEKGLTREVFLWMIDHPQDTLWANQTSDQGACVGSRPGFSECACRDKYDRRRPGNERVRIDQEVVSHLVKTYDPSSTPTLAILSVGAGEGFDDFVRVGKLLKAGYKDIRLTIIEPDDDPDVLDIFRDEMKYLADAFGASVTINRCSKLQDIPREKQHAIWAVDADFIPDLKAPYMYMACLRDRLTDEGVLQITHNGYSTGYIRGEAQIHSLGVSVAHSVGKVVKVLEDHRAPYPETMDLGMGFSSDFPQYEIIPYIFALYSQKGVREITLNLLLSEELDDERISREMLGVMRPFLPKDLKLTISLNTLDRFPAVDLFIAPFKRNYWHVEGARDIYLSTLKDGGRAIFQVNGEDAASAHAWLTDKGGEVLVEYEEAPLAAEEEPLLVGRAGGGGGE